jgi:hypothetical protein
VGTLRQPGGRQQLLGELLVHRRRAGEDARAHVRDAAHLQQALDGAVLAVRAVQHREDDVHLGQRGGHAGGRLEDGQPPSPRVAHQRDRRPARDLRQLPVGDRQALRRVGEHPAAVAGDAHGDDVVPVGVQRREDGPGGDAGDGVFCAAPAEDDRDPQLARLSAHRGRP